MILNLRPLFVYFTGCIDSKAVLILSVWDQYQPQGQEGSEIPSRRFKEARSDRCHRSASPSVCEDWLNQAADEAFVPKARGVNTWQACDWRQWLAAIVAGRWAVTVPAVLRGLSWASEARAVDRKIIRLLFPRLHTCVGLCGAGPPCSFTLLHFYSVPLHCLNLLTDPPKAKLLSAASSPHEIQ